MFISALTIVIPAFKTRYLRQTLQSFVDQTRRDFKVVIGDDNSPQNVQAIVDDYKDLMDLTYVKFPKNLGADSLADHWERCIQLAGDHDWIWFFSDDDYVDNNCVQLLWEAIQGTNGTFGLYRFDSKVVDKQSESLNQVSDHPVIENASQFLQRRLKGETISFAIEYVFRKDYFFETGGFVRFPLGWASDDATWIRMADARKIYTVKNCFVYWRYSGDNITSVYNENRYQKKRASRMFLSWVENRAKTNRLELEKNDLMYWYVKQLAIIGFAGHKQFYLYELTWLVFRFRVSPFRLVAMHLQLN
jgi:glycosyltransferase involved in cell wall biosynthesis